MKRAGIFDSGVGGVTFAKSLRAAHPELKIKVVRDDKNIPYGSKTPGAIERLTDFAIQPLLGSDVIVLACNTATAYAIDFLRAKYPDQKFVGFEPELKIARSTTKTNTTAVLATPAILRSSRYLQLKQLYGEGITIYEPKVDRLAHQIETRSVSWISLESLIKNLVNQNVDTFVLGCSHYLLIEPELQEFAGVSVKIISPTETVIKQIEKNLDLSS